jgi:hypothetical protein
VIPKYVYFGQGQDEKEDCTIPALCTGYYSSQLEEVKIGPFSLASIDRQAMRDQGLAPRLARSNNENTTI